MRLITGAVGRRQSATAWSPAWCIAPIEDLTRAAELVRGSAGLFARLAVESAQASAAELLARDHRNASHVFPAW